LVSAYAEQLAKKPASAGFFMNKTGVIHNPPLSFHPFSAFPESPQHKSIKIW